ncbi:uncharacterized protein LOC131956394 [Physella acuta]|uniref:uncharacterized protein LOC131956394 n=1 Tax=Physella acuta TaxID=109671 RepID=UPI0027DD36CE|nr:uncharacterized protein LOC131956394 [Physella acuta]
MYQSSYLFILTATIAAVSLVTSDCPGVTECTVPSPTLTQSEYCPKAKVYLACLQAVASNADCNFVSKTAANTLITGTEVTMKAKDCSGAVAVLPSLVLCVWLSLVITWFNGKTSV